MRISDWSSDVCSSDLRQITQHRHCCDELANAPRSCDLSAFPGRVRVRNAQCRRGACRAEAPFARFRTRRSQMGTYRSRGCWSEPSGPRSEEHTSELQSLKRNSYTVYCLKKKIKHKRAQREIQQNTT